MGGEPFCANGTGKYCSRPSHTGPPWTSTNASRPRVTDPSDTNDNPISYCESYADPEEDLGIARVFDLRIRRADGCRADINASELPSWI